MDKEQINRVYGNSNIIGTNDAGKTDMTAEEHADYLIRNRFMKNKEDKDLYKLTQKIEKK